MCIRDRDKLEVPRDISREELEKLALASAKVKIFLDGVTVRKVIVVPGRLVNICLLYTSYRKSFQNRNAARSKAPVNSPFHGETALPAKAVTS